MEFDIKKATILLTATGSHTYGTHTPSSDIDLRGICIPPKEYYYSPFRNFEQYDESYLLKDYPFKSFVDYWWIKNNHDEGKGGRSVRDIAHEKLDQSIYSVNKYFQLAAQCNPNIIEALFTDKSDVIYVTDLGRELRDFRDAFLSAKARYTFSGYAHAQLKRINNHRRWLLNPPNKLERKDYGLPEFSLIPAEQRGAAEKLIEKRARDFLFQEEEIDKTRLSLLQDRLGAFVSGILASSSLILDLTDSEKLIDAARIVAMKEQGMTDNYIEVLQAEKKYRAASREYQSYKDWEKNRNPERAEWEKKYGYDLKHSVHLVRLMLMCKEILLEGKVIVKRPDAGFLKDIKAGAWSFDELLKWTKRMDKEIKEIYEKKEYVVPYAPDVKKLDAKCIELIRRFHEER